MEPDSVQWVGSPCGLRGSCVFYKAFRLHLDGGRARILSLGDFFLARRRPGDPLCVAELQLLWEDRGSRQLFSSAKLYFRPEDTPQGRRSQHGQDEVIAASEKVTVKLEDLAQWARTDISKWKRGVQDEAFTPPELRKDGQREALSRFRQSTHNSGLNFKDILKEKADLGEEEEDVNVLILSYPQYCRYRSMRKRMQGKPSSVQADQFVLALGGVAAISQRSQILYCRDTFEHPTLVENERVCDEFVPNLKGRPRKKKPCGSQRRDSFNGNKESQNNCEGKTVAKVKCESRSPLSKTKNNNNNCKKGSNVDNKSKASVAEECRADEQAFLVALYKYMKERKTPIERIPYLGFKQINLWTMFQATQKLGGYETITARRQWKHIYDELGGNPGSTSAATCTRRHYERLILPYERYIKGEEDKPLPQVKPRKQEIAQEVESKIKLTGTKRIKHENVKSKKEREEAPKLQDPAEGSSAKEKNQECSLQKSSSDLTAAEAMKLSAEGSQLSPPTAPRVACLEEEEPLADTSLVSPEAMIRSPPLEELQEEPKQEICGVSCFADGLEEEEEEEEEAQAIPFGNFSSLQLPLPSQNEMEDNKIPEMADYIANCTVKVDQLGSEDIHSALKQSPKVLVVQNFDMFKEKDLPSPFNGDPGFGSTPLLYSKGNPGIMSPLAKKKLLSQVSGAALSCGNYPYGSPPPLISKKKFSSKDDLLSGRPGLLSARHSMDSAAVSRPSVIQHVQSFKPKTAEDRRPTHDAYRHESLLKKPDSECCDFSKQHLSALAESYALKSEIQDMKDRMNERRALHHSHMPGFLADFYASPPLHSLYRRAEHLGSQPCSKYFPRDVYGENAAGCPPHKLQDRRLLSYHPPLHQPENKTSRETSSDDQPTDLSLPKGGYKQTTKTLGAPLLRGSPKGAEEGKSATRFHSLTGQTLSADGNPKACRVSPMTVSAPKKQGEPLLRACKLPAPRKLDGMVHPVLSHKAMAPGIGAARPLKRSLEDLDKGLSEKKVRAVSPLRLPKEAPSKEQDAEGSKPVHGPPPGGALEGHKFPLSSPIFTNLYPGTLCSGLGSRMPATGYSHPLQYLKNQAALSPLVQPFALHSFMVHRQFLTSPGSSQQLYRHLAAASPVGSSYGDLLHNSVYPLAALNPQPAFPASQLSSVHPSTKL